MKRFSFVIATAVFLIALVYWLNEEPDFLTYETRAYGESEIGDLKARAQRALEDYLIEVETMLEKGEPKLKQLRQEREAILAENAKQLETSHYSPGPSSFGKQLSRNKKDIAHQESVIKVLPFRLDTLRKIKEEGNVPKLIEDFVKANPECLQIREVRFSGGGELMEGVAKGVAFELKCEFSLSGQKPFIAKYRIEPLPLNKNQSRVRLEFPLFPHPDKFISDCVDLVKNNAKFPSSFELADSRLSDVYFGDSRARIQEFESNGSLSNATKFGYVYEIDYSALNSLGATIPNRATCRINLNNGLVEVVKNERR